MTVSAVIHCADPAALAPFWSLATGLAIDPGDAPRIAAGVFPAEESVLLGNRDDGSFYLWLTPAEALKPVGRIHLDVTGDAVLVRALLGAGATLVREESKWTVLADPEGNELCVVHPG